MSNSSLPPLIIKFEHWPRADQAAWILGCTPPTNPFRDGPRPGAALRAETLQSCKKGYGRWLSFLIERAWLDPDEPAAQRVTKRRLRAYFQHLARAGNADVTIVGRFNQLAMSIKIMNPTTDIAWIQKPDGVTIRSQLACEQRDVYVPASDVLYQWGIEMMNDLEKTAGSEARNLNSPVKFRDGLMIAMFAARARRLRSMQLLRVGYEFIRGEQCYRVELAPHQVKTKKPDRFDLPAALSPYIDRYLGQIRPALLAGRQSEALWISKDGAPLSTRGMQTRVERLSLKRFGMKFGPHRFRHAVATTAALRDPGNPNLAAAMMNISPAVAQAHYNRADGVQASLAHADLIERRRKEVNNAA